MQVEISKEQVNNLARPLVGILERFYQDPANVESFQKWLKSVEEPKEVFSHGVCD